jgi:hypothetical protein
MFVFYELAQWVVTIRDPRQLRRELLEARFALLTEPVRTQR